MSNWRDPSWRNVKIVMDGLESETRDARGGLFGDNVIDIEEKPIIQLLVDEVSTPFLLTPGPPSILHLSGLFNFVVVVRFVLLLRGLYFYHQRDISIIHPFRNTPDDA